jgi:hypothetical protein
MNILISFKANGEWQIGNDEPEAAISVPIPARATFAIQPMSHSPGKGAHHDGA